MAIGLLQLTNFRNIQAATLAPYLAGLNILCGDNGSGKTSLLEAIHFLSMGKSFRSSQAARLIHRGESKFSVYSHIVNDTERHIPVAVERDQAGNSLLRVNEKNDATVLEVAAFLPIRLINSHSHHLFESGPIYRRKFIDWGLFYQNETFLPCWKQYEHVVKQRNTLLRQKRSKSEIDPWTTALIKHGLALDQHRRLYVEQLTPYINTLVYELLDIKNMKIRYDAGWNESVDYATAVVHAFQDEMRLGSTQYGPHRADLDITMNDISMKHILSRGQQKLLICAMIIAQGMLLAEQKKGLIYLIDDLPSELDVLSRKKLISLLLKQPSQLFITAIEKEAVCESVYETEKNVKVFHVEHGNIRSTTD